MPSVDLYEALRTTRSVRRLRPDPIPDAVLRRVLEAATWAPSGGNVQPWRVIAVRDTPRKHAIATHFRELWTRYAAFVGARMEQLREPSRERGLRILRAGDHLAEHLGEAPVLLVFVHDPTRMDRGDTGDRQPEVMLGGSLYPAVQNLLLACRAEGLGCVVNTMLWRRETALREILEIPEPWRFHALVPLGWPVGSGHGPIRRRPVAQMAYLDRFGAPLFDPG